ncbi:MAG: hypothetical protein Q4A69_06325 [Moraxella sp.]|nr:hypothetical protein [Moraxella sp.]
MSVFKSVICTALLAVCLPVFASNCSFETYIDRNDLYSSKGVRLTTIGQIIRQDRANFYAGIPSGDSPDYCGFENIKNREALQRLIDKSNISSATQRRIKRGNVYVAVDMTNRYAHVYIIE